MNRRVSKLSFAISALIPFASKSILDVGAGTGELSFLILKNKKKLKISGIDTLIRPQTLIPTIKYDGKRLPFKSFNFELLMAVDVLHHCYDPFLILKEMSRVSKRYILIKDHFANSKLDKITLTFMDFIGNRSHGVVLPYNYYSETQWNYAFKKLNLRIIKKITTLNLYPPPFNFIFDRSLHCLYLLEKIRK